MGTEVMPKDGEADKNEISELEQKIIRQIEYYFGNYNIGHDKFLREQIKLDDGWVPLETMVKFNRLKSLTEDFNVISEALKKSRNQLMEVNEDCTKIRRRLEKPIPEDKREELDSRTLYVKGFKKEATLDELLDFFKEHRVEHVFMRRFARGNKTFKGSVFATFETVEDAAKFLENNGIKYGKTELLKEKKADYVKRKDIEMANVRLEREKKKQKQGKKGQSDATENTSEPEFVPGCLLKVSNLDGDCTREDLREVFQSYGNIVYTDYSKGKPSGVIRFDSGVAPSVLEKLDDDDGKKVLKVAKSKAVVSLIEGEEELEYWKNIAIYKANARQRYLTKGPKQSNNKGKFKRGKRQKNRNEQVANEPPKKRAKIEENDEEKPLEMNVDIEKNENDAVPVEGKEE